MPIRLRKSWFKIAPNLVNIMIGHGWVTNGKIALRDSAIHSRDLPKVVSMDAAVAWLLPHRGDAYTRPLPGQSAEKLRNYVESATAPAHDTGIRYQPPGRPDVVMLIADDTGRYCWIAERWAPLLVEPLHMGTHYLGSLVTADDGNVIIMSCREPDGDPSWLTAVKDSVDKLDLA